MLNKSDCFIRFVLCKVFRIDLFTASIRVRFYFQIWIIAVYSASTVNVMMSF